MGNKQKGDYVGNFRTGIAHYMVAVVEEEDGDDVGTGDG